MTTMRDGADAHGITANLGWLFAELPFLQRFAEARRHGFRTVEFPWPPVPQAEVVAAARAAGVGVVQLNMDAGDLAAGERGWVNDPARRGKWRGAFLAAVELAERLDCPAINILAGNSLADVSRGAQRACLRDHLTWALDADPARGRVLLLEVLNRRDTPRYLLTDLDDALGVLRAVDDRRVRLQFDTYHIGVLEGPAAVPARFADVAPFVGHVQVADVPGRHEPGTGLVDFAAFFAALTDARYGAAVSAEYVPRGGTVAGLGWLGHVERWRAGR